MLEHWLILTLIVTGVAIGLVCVVTLLPATIIKRRMKRQLLRNSQGRLAITYDDGPGPKLTPPLLKLFHDYGAKATFFLVGFRAERFPDIADMIAAAGHEVGNHSHWHRHAWKTWPWLAVRDLHQGYQTMSRWMSGVAPYRPPFGKLTTWMYFAAKRRKSPLSFWTCDGADTWPTPPDPAVIAREIARAGGGVVLLHSHDRGEDRQRYVLDVTERLLQTARNLGLEVCTMSDVLNVSIPLRANSAHANSRVAARPGPQSPA